MSVLRLIPMDGRSVTTGLKGRSSLFSFDLSSATDRFPLAVQGLIIEAKFNRLTAFAWVACGLGTNVFSCQTSRDSRRLGSSSFCYRPTVGIPVFLAALRALPSLHCVVL